MNKYERISSQAVILNGGSGVLVDSLNPGHSYILTAKHVLNDDSNNKATKYTGEQIEILGVYPHSDPTIDCAILLIEKDSSIATDVSSVEGIAHTDQCMVAGFPETRRHHQSNQDKIKLQDGNMSSIVNGGFIFNAAGIPSKELINGMSGGGVYWVKGDLAFLVGIEHSMDGDHEAEQYGRLKGCCIEKFQDIVKEFSLPPILPYFLSCFSAYKATTFEFNAIVPKNVAQLRSQLSIIADAILKNQPVKPYEVLKLYQGSLLLLGEDSTSEMKKELWSAYFEFLIISAILDSTTKVDPEYVKGLARRRRLIYSSSEENWMRFLPEIIKSARHMLDAEGSIVVASAHKAARPAPPPDFLADVIADIAQISIGEDGQLDIGSANDEIYRSFKISHLTGLENSCVVEREKEYGAAKGNEPIQIFKGYYNEFIK